MPIDVSEGSLELSIELLEAVTPTRTSYPFPSLRRTGRIDSRVFRTVIIENAFLRATVAPLLGGRIIRFEDKRSQMDVWPFQLQLAVLDGGPRGVQCSAGLEVLTSATSRLNSMGTMSFAMDFDGESESANGIWLSEICGDGLSLHIRYSMPEDRPELEIECRVFNRTLEYLPYNGGLRVDGADFERIGDGWRTGSGSGFCLTSENQALGHAEDSQLLRFESTRYLAPRQLEVWKARLTPNRIAHVKGVSGGFFAGWSDAALELESAGPRILGGKVVIQTRSGESLEMPLDLHTEQPVSIDLASLPSQIEQLALLDRDGTAQLVLPEAEWVMPSREPMPAPDRIGAFQMDEQALHAATFDVKSRHWAHLCLGYRKLSESDPIGAARHFEQSLLFNAEDHLAWLFKAICDRLAGHVDDERPELLNAHFLAPLEPGLRAESYLAAPSQVKDKSPLLNAFEETPEAFVEVACLLLEAELWEESAKWLDEALRHADLAMLRYLLAYAYLQGSRMEVQAAEQLQVASRLDFAPPFPWRPIEKRALETLASRFPDDPKLKSMLQMSPSMPSIGGSV